MSLRQSEANPASRKGRKVQGAVPPEAAPAIQTAVTHVIALDPADWYVATWRRLPPLPRPDPAPFDPHECADRITRVTVRGNGWKWDWTRASVSAGLGPEEARFWFEAMTLGDASTKPKELAPWMARHEFLTLLTPHEIFHRLKKSGRLLTPEIVLPLRVLLSPAGIVEALLGESLGVYDHHPTFRQPSWFLRGALLAGFRKYVVPYLGSEETERLRELVAQAPPDDAAPDSGRTLSPRLLLAAALGMHGQVLEAVSRWPDRDRPGPTADDAYHVLFGLGDPRLVDFHLRRLALWLWHADHVRAWLAHTELSALDRVRDDVLAAAHKDEAAAMLEVFCLVQAPEAAPHILELRLKAKAPSLARQWLDAQVGNAIAGLVPVAAGRGKLAEAALEYLREAQRRGHAGLIEEQLRAVPAAGAARLRDVLAEADAGCLPLDEAETPAWLRKASGERLPRLPEWVRPTALPPLLLGDRSLTERHVSCILAALRRSTLAEPLPLVGLLREHLDCGRLDAFAWRLFELWQAEGAPLKDRWALAAVGLLGGDACALKLAAQVRGWPALGQHRRALLGLECLRAIGTDTALMQLNALAHKVRFKRVQERARSFIDEIARDRGLSHEQLEDRIVPDLDLDSRGSRVFDLGPRRFRFVIGPDFKPLLRDEAGKLRPNLPRTNARDDPTKASAAAAAWKLLKKQVREVVKDQAHRLERAMIDARRWTVADFERFLVGHPLMINLARLLVWGAYDAKNRLLWAFRVTEDGTLADVEDTTRILDGVSAVAVVHPLHLSEAQRAAWGEVLGDYEIIPPFLQLGRRVHILLPGEETSRELTRFGGVSIPAMIFWGILKSYGWTDARWQEDRWYGGLYKRFPGQLVTACLAIHTSGDTVRITRVYFAAGVDAETDCDPRHALPLGHVDPVAVSEVLGSLAVVASKGA